MGMPRALSFQSTVSTLPDLILFARLRNSYASALNNCSPTTPKMIRRRISTILVVNIVVLLPVSAFSSNVTCPYDIPFAAGMMPPACYANATATAIASGFSSVTNCCWFVFAAYIYAAIRHANLTGAAFLPPSTAAVCSSSFSSYLITHGLARPSLLLSNSSCNLDGDPVRLAAGSRPCQFPFVSLVRSSADLSQADRLCTSPPLDPDSHLNLCSSCQTAVIKITFALLNATKSKEFVPCGMAATLAIWSPHNPSLPRFRSFALCMLQVLQNIGDLGTGNLIPSPPSFPPPFLSTYSPVRSSTKTTKIVAGSAAAASVSFLGIVALIGFLIRKRMRKRKLFSTDIAAVEVIPASPALPTEGLYIFTKAELKQATNGYDERLLLGFGGAGKVYLGKLPSGHQVAIKRIYREKKLTEFYSEVEVLAKLRHRNLTTLVGYYLGERDEHALVYEYMAGGNLARALAGEVGLPWTRRLHIAAEVAAGLAYLHDFLEGAVVHRDVKPTNILLTEDGKAKLSDFGVSRIVPPEGSHVSTEVRGTLGYVDPESFSVGHVSETADVYSFGVVLLELVTGMKAVVPTPSGGAESIVHAARAAVAATSDVGVIVDRRLGPSWDRPTILSTFELARRCVRPYKEERPAMREVLSELRALIADLEARTDGGIVAALSSVAKGGMSPSPSPMSTTTEERTWSRSDSCS